MTMTSGRQWESFISFIKLRFHLHRLEVIIIHIEALDIRIWSMKYRQTGSRDIQIGEHSNIQKYNEEITILSLIETQVGVLENMRLVRAILIRAYLKPSRSLEFSIN